MVQVFCYIDCYIAKQYRDCTVDCKYTLEPQGSLWCQYGDK